MSDTTTNGIRVQVASFYVEERSDPENGRYFFAYRVKISNTGTETARLVSREWIITDADGNEERVEGPGVVGEQPVLNPGESFEYTSFCPAADARRHDARQLLDGEARRKQLRGCDRPVFPRSAGLGELGHLPLPPGEGSGEGRT